MAAVLPFPHEDKKDGKTGRPPRLLGEILCARGVLNDEQLRLALHEQKNKPDLLGRVLVKLQFAHERDVLEALSQQTGYVTIRLSEVVPSPEVLMLWDEPFCQRVKAVPLYLEEGVLAVALADPFDIKCLDAIRGHAPKGVMLRLVLAAETDLQGYVRRHYASPRGVNYWLREIEQQSPCASAEGAEQPVIQVIDALLQEAVVKGASDIHLEPESQSVRVRLRCDGALHTLSLLHRNHWPMLARRIKILAGMDIVDTKAIQDGRFDMQVEGRTVDFRVSVLPVQYGENIVIRVLDQARALLPLDALGFTMPQQNLLKRLCLRPEGMMVITGPTGSGKTTTLYALLQNLKHDSVNIMTLEDPVEYQLPGIRQTQVREQYGLGFAEGVRAILRQDPNVVLIGEVRDPETAQMALRAAMTGSQVLTTLHTQDCFGVFARLREFGVSPHLMAGNIMATVAQRLVRTLCPHCRQRGEASTQECALMGINAAAAPDIGHARGCALCDHTGYAGRTVIAEILPLGAELNEQVAAGAPRSQLLHQARKKGFVTMAEEGIRRLQAGDIDLPSLMAKIDISSVSGQE